MEECVRHFQSLESSGERVELIQTLVSDCKQDELKVFVDWLEVYIGLTNQQQVPSGVVIPSNASSKMASNSSIYKSDLVDQTYDIFDQPDDSLVDQPNDIFDQPDNTEDQLDDTEDQPDDTEDQPDDSEDQLDDTENQPNDTEDQPDDTEDQPDDTVNQPDESVDHQSTKQQENPDNKRNKTKCDICSKVFSTAIARNKHMRIHSSRSTETLLTCHVCYQQFGTANNLQTHIESCLKSSFKCETCDLGFKTQATFSRHCNKHQVLMQLPCDKCDKVFNRSWHLTRHMKSVHDIAKAAEQNFSCHYCGKKYTTVSSLKYHLIIHENPDGLVACDECDKTFMREKNLAKHKALQHSECDILCSQCAKVFKNSRNLRLHYKVVHESERLPFECDVCKKRFIGRNKLAQHKINVHVKSRPHSCRYKECGKAYNDTSNRNCHERRSHGATFTKSMGLA